MEHSQWQQPPPPGTVTQPQPPPPGTVTQPAEVDQSAVDAYYSTYYAYYAPLPAQSQYPNPNSSFNPAAHVHAAITTLPPVPITVPYDSAGSYPDSAAAAAPASAVASAALDAAASADPAAAAPASAAASAAVVAYQTVDAASHFGLETNPQDWAWRQAVRLYGADPQAHGGAINGLGQPVAAHPGPAWPNPLLVQAQVNGSVALNKGSKKVKISQSMYCEVCKVDCNSPNVLEQHKLGRKHLKNLEKLQPQLQPQPQLPPQPRPQVCSSADTASSAAGTEVVPVIGPQENPDKSKATKTRKKKKKKSPESTEDMEAKKRKIVEGGATEESVRMCTICNIVCNSEKVYKDHIAGQRHIAIARKQESQAGLATVN